MEPQKIRSDGITDFSGGMDSYTSPSLLQKNQFYYSVNCQIKPGISGIMTRSGYRGIKLVFESKRDEDFFNNGRIQGCGYYIHKGLIIQLVSCDGRIFEFEEVNRLDEFKVRYVGIENSYLNRTAYFSKVPRGAIINDSESAPVACRDRTYSRIKGRKSIKAGRAGIYIQNRFFYINSNGKSIEFSSFNDSTSINEAILANLQGFYTPDDTDITAIGEQKFIQRDSNGGSLVFSTQQNLYSIRVNGSVTAWGDPNNDLGKISGDMYDVAAVSPHSFLSANGNTYFRSRSLGLASLQYLQFIWNNVDIVEPQSYGGHMFFNNDDEYLLDSTYSVRYNNNIYTTVAPNLQDNCVYWSGILATRPGQKGILRYDSLHTGLNPWCMQVVKDSFAKEYFYIFSRDNDGKNRLYVVDDRLDYDIRVDKTISPIESQFASRFYNFNDPFSIKKCQSQMYGLAILSDVLKTEVFARHNEGVNFSRISEETHLNKLCASRIFENRIATERYKEVHFSDGLSSDNYFYQCQDLIKLTGSFRLDKIIRTAMASLPDSTPREEDKIIKFNQYVHKKLYSYLLYGNNK